MCLAAQSAAAIGAAVARGAVVAAGAAAMVAAGTGNSGLVRGGDFGGLRHRRKREDDQAKSELQFRFHFLFLGISGWAEILIREPMRAAVHTPPQTCRHDTRRSALVAAFGARGF